MMMMMMMRMKHPCLDSLDFPAVFFSRSEALASSVSAFSRSEKWWSFANSFKIANLSGPSFWTLKSGLKRAKFGATKFKFVGNQLEVFLNPHIQCYPMGSNGIKCFPRFAATKISGLSLRLSFRSPALMISETRKAMRFACLHPQ